MSLTALSKEEYLKRYLSGGADDNDKVKKKKKKKNKDKIPAKSLPNVRIIDNDVAFPAAEDEAPIAINSDHEDIEELPVIASVQDDRDIEVQVKEEFEKSGKWKTFHGDNIARKNLINEVIKLEQSDIKPEPLDEDEYPSEFLYPKKRKKIKKEKPDRVIKQEKHSPVRRRRRHDSDASPPRRRHDSDNSPPRKKPKDESDSDMEVPRRGGKDDDSDIDVPRKGGSDS